MAAPVRYRIIERNVQYISKTDVGEMINEVTRYARRHAKVRGPMRSGKLIRSVNINRSKANGYLKQQGVLYANARHALWVHEGTKGPIKSKSGKAMPIPKRKYGSKPPTILKQSVRGQKANPFLSQAIAAGLRKNNKIMFVGANRIQ